MSTFDASIEKHHRPIIFTLVFMLGFFSLACTFHETIPVCHYLFGCDHKLHVSE